MRTRTYSRILLIALIGISFYICTALTRPVGAGGQDPAGSTPGVKQVIGDVPALAKPENFTGYKPLTDSVRMLISFDLQHPKELQELTEQLYDPASPLYHQWLTPEEFGRRFGRSEKEFNRAVQWLQEQGMEVDRPYSNRLSIGFTGTVEVVQRSFNVVMGSYWDPKESRAFYSNMSLPSLPADLDRITIRLQGLSNAVLFHVASRGAKLIPAKKQEGGASQQGGQVASPNVVITGGFEGLGPNDLAVLYDYQPLWTAGQKGQGQQVATIIDSDISNTDMTTFRSDMGLPAQTVTRVVYTGFSNPGVTGDEVEAEIDTEAISDVAPSAQCDMVLIPNLESTNVTTVENDIISQNTIKSVSESFGGCESTNWALSEQNVFAQAVTQGIAFFASAGDEGTDCDPPDPATTKGVECPACYPGVTGVGGTSVVANFNGSGVVTSRSSEVVWNTPPGIRFNCTGQSEPNAAGASGGGISTKVSIPTFQSTSQGFTGGVPAGSFRFVPDVSAIAAPGPGPNGVLMIIQGQPEYGGGTSQSSPLLAGMMALINQKLGSAQGNPNTTFYRLGVNEYKNAGPKAFVDVTSGNNSIGVVSPCLPSGKTGYSAGVGYDSVSGLGVPDINVLALNWSGSAPPPPNYVGFVDGASCTTISGWAADRNALNTSINVEIYDGTTLLTTVLANNSRPDVASYLGSASYALYGFSLPTPTQLLNGAAHTVHVKFSTSTTELTGSPVTLTCGTNLPPNYIGFIDSASCTSIAGWAADKNHLSTSVNVELYDGSTLIAVVPATNSRPDVETFLGSTYALYGYSIATPDSLKTGATHTLHIKFATSTTELTGSPASVNCTRATPNYVGFVDVASCTQIGGWAADRNRLNTSITVSLYDGSTLLETVVAKVSRPDVGAYLGDNGLHGFSFVTPSSLMTGSAHSIHVKFETSATDLSGSPASLTCAAPSVVQPPLASAMRAKKPRGKARLGLHARNDWQDIFFVLPTAAG
jgi:subtilase family serine protease